MRKNKVLVPLAITIGVAGCNYNKSEKRDLQPNILWVSCEDITTMLECYGDKNASTPNFDAFADKSVRFTNAFATAPVSSPSRSCIITGQYAVTLGSQHLRSWVSIPDNIKPFPKFLREHGYYVSNNYKEDYNFADTTIWNNSSPKAHWRNRDKGQPFFSVINLEMTHQSSIFGSDSVYEARIHNFLPFIKRCSPDSLILPSYYPDSPVIRKLWARYYTNVSIVDYQFGQIIKELEEDGLEDNTIVFFFADHGTGMPRSKRTLYDSGIRIPLLVHVPGKLSGKFNMPAGKVADRLVSFIDFAPTMLEITGIDVPADLGGIPFISAAPLKENPFVFAMSDRVDEAYELSRSVHTKQYHYIRNYLPHLPVLQPNFYTDQSEIMKELVRLKNESVLNRVQLTLFSSQRTPEELYDVISDPDEVNNLAYDNDYQKIVADLRLVLKEKIIKSFDTGLMPEPEMIRLSSGLTPYEIAHKPDIFPIKKILEVSDLMLDTIFSTDKIIKGLNDKNGFVRYWAVIDAEQMSKINNEITKELIKLLDDDFPAVQIEAAKVLVSSGKINYVSTLLRYIDSNEKYLALYAARSFQEVSHYFHKIPDPVYETFKRLDIETQKGADWSDYYKIYTYWSLSAVLNVKKQ